jgi:cytochrome c oxidase subunit 2
MTQCSPWQWAAAALLLSGCGGRQAVLNPKGPHAAELAQLSWLLFAFGAFVLLIVVVAVVLAVRGPAWGRAILASTRAVVWAGIVFPAVTLTALLGHAVWLTRAAMVRTVDANAVHVGVIGEQWWWRIAYRQGDSQVIATANELRIPVGRPIVLTLASADVIHSFWVPNLGGKLDMIPGRTTELRLTADEPGVYRGQCAEYCGGPHALMAIEVVALPAAEFEVWLESQGRPGAEPSTDLARRGRELFLQAGCGGCHTVRGTPAAGTIGPDLTHLASRRSVGLDTLPLTAANIALFIRDGQHIKPGNAMPPFRIFAPADLDAVAAYLADLR